MLLSVAAIPLAPYTAPVIYHFFNHEPLEDLFVLANELPRGVALILIWLTILRLDGRRGAALIYFLIALILGSAAITVLKKTAGRARPEVSLLARKSVVKDVKKLAREYPAVILATDDRPEDLWLFWRPSRPYDSSHFTSFPSGHAMTAGVMGATFCALYPRARWIWVFIMVSVALARVESRRHYMEDTFFALGLGWLLTWWVFGWRWPAVLGRKLRLGTDGLVADRQRE